MIIHTVTRDLKNVESQVPPMWSQVGGDLPA